MAAKKQKNNKTSKYATWPKAKPGANFIRRRLHQRCAFSQNQDLFLNEDQQKSSLDFEAMILFF